MPYKSSNIPISIIYGSLYLVTCTEEILNEKLHFLCSDSCGSLYMFSSGKTIECISNFFTLTTLILRTPTPSATLIFFQQIQLSSHFVFLYFSKTSV